MPDLPVHPSPSSRPPVLWWSPTEGLFANFLGLSPPADAVRLVPESTSPADPEPVGYLIATSIKSGATHWDGEVYLRRDDADAELNEAAAYSALHNLPHDWRLFALHEVVRYIPGRMIQFSSGNWYHITAVEDDRVTFARPDDPEDNTTETIADLDAVDVRVVAAPQAREVTR